MLNGLPGDPVMLLSVVNTKLRDQYHDLNVLCDDMNVAKEEIEFKKDPESMSREELEKLIKDVKKQMDRAAADLNFEAAAELRDKMLDLRRMVEEIKQDSGKKG